MAVKLEKSKTMSGDSRYSIKLTITETATSIQDNTSTISYKLEATKSKGSGFYSNSAVNSVKITINGSEEVNKKITYDFQGSTPKTITLASGTKTIKHEDDGTKTISCSGYFKDGAGNGLGSATASGNLTLTQLHTPPFISISEYFLNGNGTDPNNCFDNITILKIEPHATTYDGAEMVSYEFSSNGVQAITDGTYYYLNFIDKQLENRNITIKGVDNKGGVSIGETVFPRIAYAKPTINKLSAKRVGQLSGDIKIKASGTYFNQSGYGVVPTAKYSIKQGETTIVNETTASSLTYSDGAWSIEEDLTNVCDYDKSYEVIITITDGRITTRNSDLPTIGGTQVDPVSIPTATTIVPLGEPTWTEYKDRVDFKKLTIQGVEIPPLEINEGSSVVSRTSGATLRSSDYYKYGNVVELRIVCDTTSSTSEGSDCFTGTINDSSLFPVDYATGVGFNGSSLQVAQISPTGDITIRVLASSLASSKAFGIHFTYLVN